MAEKEWFRDDGYWRDNRCLIWSSTMVDFSGKQVDRIVELLQMSRGDSVLDLACGFGRHSLEFARRGFAVTGVDLNRGLLEEAVEQARSANLGATFLNADMREFSREEAFHHIVILYNSFGYFTDPADDAKVLENCFRSLKPGGRLLLSTVGREVLKSRLPSGKNRHWREEEGLIVLEESKLNEDWSWINTRWIVLDGQNRRNYEYGLRVYGETQLKESLRDSGFVDVRTYGGLSGIPYDAEAHSLLAVAVRPGEQKRNAVLE